jgi:hypothetical protein
MILAFKKMAKMTNEEECCLLGYIVRGTPETFKILAVPIPAAKAGRPCHNHRREYISSNSDEC